MGPVETFREAQTRLLDRFGVAAESVFLDVPAVKGRAHVLVAGDGPPVVLVPGFADPAVMWAPLMAHLHGFTCLSVDRPCFGLSGHTEHRTSTLRRLAVDYLTQVLDGLRLEHSLFVANSIGSLWVLWLALDRPERVTAMVHVGCPAFMLGTSAPLPMRLLSIRPVGRLLMTLDPPSPRQVRRFARTIGGADLSTLPELVDVLVAAQRLPGAQSAVLDLLHAVVRLQGGRPGIVIGADQLRRLHQPARLVWGSRDVFGAPEVGREAARILPNATLHVIERGGHVPWIGHAEEVGALTRSFLQMHGVPSATAR